MTNEPIRASCLEIKLKSHYVLFVIVMTGGPLCWSIQLTSHFLRLLPNLLFLFHLQSFPFQQIETKLFD